MQGILRIDSIESAIARPYCGYFDTLAEKAAALLESMVGNHGFADGNKRTAVLLVCILIDLVCILIVDDRIWCLVWRLVCLGCILIRSIVWVIEIV